MDLYPKEWQRQIGDLKDLYKEGKANALDKMKQTKIGQVRSA